jgi:myxalamid-type polyketide synthase MxaB
MVNSHKLSRIARVFQSDRLIVEEVTFQQALKLPEGEVKTIQLVLTPEESSIYSFQIFSLQGFRGRQ